METTPSPSPKTRRLIGLALAFVVILTLAFAATLALRNGDDNVTDLDGDGIDQCDELFAEWLEVPSGSEAEVDLETQLDDAGCDVFGAGEDSGVNADYEPPTEAEINDATVDELYEMYGEAPSGSDAETRINDELTERGEFGE